jgi:hypothetical protein
MRAKPEDICWGNASKTINDFALVVARGSSTNYVMEGIVVPVVITPFMIFRDAGSTMGV